VTERAPVIVVGAGGHGAVVADILLSDHPRFELMGFTDANAKAVGPFGYPVLGDDSVLASLHAEGLRHALVGLGDNGRRAQAAAVLAGIGLDSPTLISARAAVSSRATLGVGVVVMPGAVINAGAQIGDFAIVNSGAVVDHDCRVGRFAHLAPNCTLAGQVVVGPHCFVGAGASVIPGVSLGAGAVVGAGACVLADVPDEVVAIGVPARPMPPKAARP
jgi:UDP-perosamine 4-acetyltransferase